MKDFSQLKRNLKNDYSLLTPIKIALLGDSSTQLLKQALQGMGYDHGFNLQIWEAGFNQIEQYVFDPQSELYDFEPEVVIIFQSSHKLLNKYNKLIPEKHSSFAGNQLELIDNLCESIKKKLSAKIICYNYAEIDDAVFGSYANKTTGAFLFQLRKLNYLLMDYATRQANLYICDMSGIQNHAGKQLMFRPSIYVNTEMVLSVDILPLVAARTIEVISAVYGYLKKCVIVDLDNTLWGGIIGDDGLENIQLGNLGIGKAFTEFQHWLKKLKNRGIILAVCSKNTDAVAREPFEKHPDMVLRLDDIAVFIANWNNKADNIRHLQQVLNIGFDSMVFLDDNPFERNIVRENIPELTIPELPEDPAEYLEYLYTLNLFETAAVSTNDAERTKQYQAEAARATLQAAFVNEDDFLKSLHMVSVVEPFNNFNAPRAAQLSQRSNQFNLRTIRYTEADIKQIMNSSSHYALCFTLADKLGDNGLIGVIVLKKETDHILFIENWLMSCRVLKRGMENFMLNSLADFALKNSFNCLKGEYIQTTKNALVKDHYLNLGFKPHGGYWMLDLERYEKRGCFVEIA